MHVHNKATPVGAMPGVTRYVPHVFRNQMGHLSCFFSSRHVQEKIRVCEDPLVYLLGKRMFLTSFLHFKEFSKRWQCEGDSWWPVVACSVAVPHHVDADVDPDPACHLDADTDPSCHLDVDPDPACHFDADPNPDPTLSL
jgi:hypothetical protein